MDSGIEQGTVIGGQFDSMLAKLIVTGATREEAIARSIRALDEYIVEGLPTVLPFHRAMMEDPAFTAPDGNYRVYTRWIEEEWNNNIPEYNEDPVAENDGDLVQLPKQKVIVEVDGRRVELLVPGELLHAGTQLRRSKRRRGSAGQIAITGDTVASPMQGTVIKVDVGEGQHVNEGDPILVLEAMKMENAVKAHKSGVVTNLSVVAGAAVTKNQALLDIAED